jgi:hypothetical protein
MAFAEQGVAMAGRKIKFKRGLYSFTRNNLFDEQPCSETNSEDIDFRAASEFFSSISLLLTSSGRKPLGLLVNHGGRDVPTHID